jgi:hypothetical protein
MLLEPDEGQSRGIMEVADYPAHSVQVAVSSVVLLTSMVILARTLSQRQVLQGAALYLLSTGVIFILLFLPQYREFQEVKRATGEGKPYVIRGKRGGMRVIGLEVVLLASAIVVPFILSASLSAATWFSLVLGLVAGFSSSQLGFILYVRNWEKANSVHLERYRVTVEGDGRGRLVVERGVRPRR